MACNQNELYHHGIKGMRWGVRRFQNKDGTLTNAGKKRYDKDSNPKKNLIQKHKEKLVQKYIEKGYSKSAAEVAAENRMRAELVVGTVAAVSVAIIATKAATRIGQDYCDKVIKSGVKIQNIGANRKATFKDSPFYAAINRNDKRAYGAMYPHEKRGMASKHLGYDGIYNNTIKITKDVKRASVKNARKALYDKMNSDPKFKKEVIETLKSTAYGKDAASLFKSNPSKFYDKFNQALATHEFQSKGLHKQFYSELEKRGYNAILDINDTRYSGYSGIAKAPTIFFGNDGWEKIASRKLSDQEIDKNLEKYSLELIAKKLGKLSLGVAGGAYAANNISDSQKVEMYLDEHPNSKLSRKEILKMYDDEFYK